MSLVFRRLAPNDIALLHNVADDVFDDRVEPERARRFLADRRAILVVAVTGGTVVGQIQAIVHLHPDAPPDLFIDNLGVAPAWRRRGIARNLIALARAAGREQGADEGWVLTEGDDEVAGAVYESAGGAPSRTILFTFRACEEGD
jgi:aminoglycoside 6'-N-acetyltransferase I